MALNHRVVPVRPWVYRPNLVERNPVKKRMIYAIFSTLSVVIGAIFFTDPFSGGDQPTPQQTSGVMSDTSFVNLIQGNAPYYMADGDRIIAQGKAVCIRFDGGESGTDIHDSMVAAVPAESAKDAEFFLSASVTQYCTKYTKEIAKYVQH